MDNKPTDSLPAGGQNVEAVHVPAQGAAPSAPGTSTPSAAETVIAGKTEREIALEKQLAEREATIKNREREVAEARDQAHQFKQLLEAPKPQPKRKESKSAFYFGQDDDEE